MPAIEKLITDNIDVWSSVVKRKNSQGRGSSKKIELYGIKKLRELILELAVRGMLVPQNPNDEPASVLVEKIVKEKAKLVKEGKIKKQKALPQLEEEQIKIGIKEGWFLTQLGAVTEIAPRSILDDDLKVGFVPMPKVSTSHKGSHGQEVRVWGDVKKGYTHFSNGDIGLAKITPCFENSKAVVFSGLENGHGAGTTELHIARPIKGTIDPFFILLYLKSPKFLEVGKTKMTGSAGQKRVPNTYFSGNPLPLPPLAEQHRIVAKVDELMALCDQLESKKNSSITAHEQLVEVLLNTLTQSANNQELTNNWQRLAEHFDTLFTTESSIEKLKQTILQLAVMGKLVPQDPNDEPASVLLEKIAKEKERLIAVDKLKTKASEIINDNDKYLDIPDVWESCRLGNLAKFIDYRGKTPNKLNSGVRLITAKNVKFGFISLQPEEFISEEEYSSWMTRGFPRVGDILFTPEAPLGNVAIVDINEKFALAQRAICFQFHVARISEFVKILIMSRAFQEQLIENATGMTARGIKASRLKEILVPLPSIDEQRRIVKKVNDLMAICELLKASLTEAQITQLSLADALAKQAII